jgi:hypothetical protein
MLYYSTKSAPQNDHRAVIRLLLETIVDLELKDMDGFPPPSLCHGQQRRETT